MTSKAKSNLVKSLYVCLDDVSPQGTLTAKPDKSARVRSMSGKATRSTNSLTKTTGLTLKKELGKSQVRGILSHLTDWRLSIAKPECQCAQIRLQMLSAEWLQVSFLSVAWNCILLDRRQRLAGQRVWPHMGKRASQKGGFKRCHWQSNVMVS